MNAVFVPQSILAHASMASPVNLVRYNDSVTVLPLTTVRFAPLMAIVLPMILASAMKVMLAMIAS